jgi:hypothetical protein
MHLNHCKQRTLNAVFSVLVAARTSSYGWTAVLPPYDFINGKPPRAIQE